MITNSEKYSKTLNPKQLEAVKHEAGPLLIAAGAGSGKTRTLTSRIARLIESGVKPENILAITFTNKAANEMRDRISQYQTIGISKLFVGTFHSFGAKILRQEHRYFNRTKSFTIFDDDDGLSLLKKLLKNRNLDKDKHNPLIIQNHIAKIKNELKNLPTQAASDHELLDQLFIDYEQALENNNAFDFDDLIEKPVKLFQNNREILEKYQKQCEYILVDEYQDINTSQYQLIKFLAKHHRNLNVVGDDAQCLLPNTKIKTSGGVKSIANLSNKDWVLAASGNGEVSLAPVKEIKKFDYKGPIIKITTNTGKVLKLTPNHIIFTRLQLTEGTYYTYLMYRKDKGFRIGITKGTRTARSGKKQIGLITRNNQEKADKMWVLKICQSRSEAEYWEFYYAFYYGIPTVVFDTGNRNMKLKQSQIDTLYQKINTKKRGGDLLEQELLFESFPHWLPKGTIRHQSCRLRVRLTMFDDRRKSLKSPWGMSRLSINTKDKQLKEEVENLGFKTRKGKFDDWRLELTSLKYEEIERSVERLIKNLKREVEVVKSACLTKNKRLFFQPASHTRETMTTAAFNNKKITEETIIKVETEHYEGCVYDINVKNLHNYIANEIVVHNSIYSFRGADFRNFLNFERDWPEAKVVFLEENYRSTPNILQAANEIIKNNKFQKQKNLWTKNAGDDLIKVFVAEDDLAEAEWVVSEIMKLVRNKTPLNQIAILYRTNAQSRAIEQALIYSRIAYQIFGGLRFYERKEIKDIMAGLRLANNPRDTVSAERLLKNFSKSKSINLIENLPRLAHELNAVQLINYFINNTDYFEYLEKNFRNHRERLENVKELLAFAASFGDKPEALSAFLEQVSLAQSHDQSKQEGGVNLMTIHLAKGLEFDHVFLVGCSEGTLPHHRSFNTNEELEEERRLMYVAVTRAAKSLFLSFSNIPSRFLYDIPPELIKYDGPQPKQRNTDGEDLWIDYE